MVRQIYVDLYFLVNFFMNAALLWGTACLTKLQPSAWRIVFGAAAGALYSIAFLFPALSFLLGPEAKIFFALLMLAIAFPRVGISALLKVCACFLVLSFSVAGIALGLMFLPLRYAWDPGFHAGGLSAFVESGVKAASPATFVLSFFGRGQGYPWWLLAALTATALAMVSSSWAYLRYQSFRRQNIYTVDIILFGRKVRLKGFLDTGNALREPISGRPVVVAEYEALSHLLPEEVAHVMEALEGDPGDASVSALARVAKGEFATRFRIVPFRSLGRETGIILGFRPDALVVHKDGRPTVVRDVVVGLWGKRLPGIGGAPRGPEGCHVLLSPYIFFDAAELRGKAS